MNKNVEKSLQLTKDKRAKVKKRECYYNAFKAVQYVPEYAQADYVEGFAVFPEGLVIEHGWVESAGEVIDPTLSTDEIVYFLGLRCEGQLELSRLMGDTQSVGVPFFYAFGWGGHDHAGFREARRLAMAYSDTVIARAKENTPHESSALSS